MLEPIKTSSQFQMLWITFLGHAKLKSRVLFPVSALNEKDKDQVLVCR